MKMLGAFMLCFALAAFVQAQDGGLPAGLVAGGQARVASLVDGDTLTLDDGRIVRLVGIQAPKLPLDRPGFEPWPLADAAKAALAELAVGQAVKLYYGGARLDRHGRLLAHLVRRDGVWLQAAMLERGLARVYSFADNRVGVAAMLAAESQARTAGRGIWSDAFYAVREPAVLAAHPEADENSFQIVRGRVLDTGEARGKLYVNFGGRWKTDFTLEVPARVRRQFADDARLDPARLAGALIEVRGWIVERNGPMISISHPEQIVFLTGPGQEGERTP